MNSWFRQFPVKPILSRSDLWQQPFPPEIMSEISHQIPDTIAEQDSNLLFDQQKVCDSPYPIYESNVYLATSFFVVILKLSPKKLILSRFYPRFVWIKKVKTYTRNVTAASLPTLLINKKA